MPVQVHLCPDTVRQEVRIGIEEGADRGTSAVHHKLVSSYGPVEDGTEQHRTIMRAVRYEQATQAQDFAFHNFTWSIRGRTVVYTIRLRPVVHWEPSRTDLNCSFAITSV